MDSRPNYKISGKKRTKEKTYVTEFNNEILDIKTSKNL